jgi:hypothetical protein
MEALSAIERIVRDLLVVVVAMSVVLGALMVIISRRPNADHGGAELSRRRYGCGRDAGYSCNPDPRP